LGTASLVIGIVLIITGVYYFLSPVSPFGQDETMWGPWYLFATEEELGERVIWKIIVALIFVIAGGFFLRKYNKDKKKSVN